MYRFDVFVSYRRHDLGREWIGDYFVPELKRYLELELGRKPKIFWDDQSIDDGQIPRNEILNALRDSICILPVLSKYYFNSAWCSAEWQTFLDRAQTIGGQSLTVPITWHDSENYERDFGSAAPKAGVFNDYRLTGPAWVKTDLYVKFQTDVGRLAETLARLIVKPPAFNPSWTSRDPDAIGPLKTEEGEWRYKLMPEGGSAT